jgi:hypothetical protein
MLPWTSVAVYVTSVVPTGNVSPEELVEVDPDTPQLSVIRGAFQLTCAEHRPASLLIEISADNPSILGASSSVTVTKKLEELSLPWMSVVV